MLEMLAYTVVLLVAMPALLYGVGKLIFAYSTRLSSEGRVALASAIPAPRYEALHERLVAAAEANPLLPRVFSRSKKVA